MIMRDLLRALSVSMERKAFTDFHFIPELFGTEALRHATEEDIAALVGREALQNVEKTVA
jgi:hypothetical protein